MPRMEPTVPPIATMGEAENQEVVQPGAGAARLLNALVQQQRQHDAHGDESQAGKQALDVPAQQYHRLHQLILPIVKRTTFLVEHL